MSDQSHALNKATYQRQSYNRLYLYVYRVSPIFIFSKVFCVIIYFFYACCCWNTAISALRDEFVPKQIHSFTYKVKKIEALNKP